MSGLAFRERTSFPSPLSMHRNTESIKDTRIRRDGRLLRLPKDTDKTIFLSELRAINRAEQMLRECPTLNFTIRMTTATIRGQREYGYTITAYDRRLKKWKTI